MFYHLLDYKLARCYMCPIQPMAGNAIQLELHPRTWGGKRPGAGRKPSGLKVGVPHRPGHLTTRATPCT